MASSVRPSTSDPSKRVEGEEDIADGDDEQGEQGVECEAQGGEKRTGSTPREAASCASS